MVTTAIVANKCFEEGGEKGGNKKHGHGGEEKGDWEQAEDTKWLTQRNALRGKNVFNLIDRGKGKMSKKPPGK